MTKGYIVADVGLFFLSDGRIDLCLDVVVGRCSPLRLSSRGRCCIFRTGPKPRYG